MTELLPHGLPIAHDTVYVPVAVVVLVGAVTVTEDPVVALVMVPLLTDQLYELAPVAEAV